MIAYAQQLDSHGLLIRASAAIPPAALEEAARVVESMLQGPHSPSLRQALIAAQVRVAVLGEHEQITDVPGLTDLDTAHPLPDGQPWAQRARAIGPTLERPVCVFDERNMFDLPSNLWGGEKTAQHEFAHAIHMAARAIYPPTDTLMDWGWNAAKAAGLYQEGGRRAYAIENPGEWFAEASQCRFDCQRVVAVPDGIHNHIGTWAQLQAYDPYVVPILRLAYGDSSESLPMRSFMSMSVVTPDDGPCLIPLPG